MIINIYYLNTQERFDEFKSLLIFFILVRLKMDKARKNRINPIFINHIPNGIFKQK